MSLALLHGIRNGTHRACAHRGCEEPATRRVTLHHRRAPEPIDACPAHAAQLEADDVCRACWNARAVSRLRCRNCIGRPETKRPRPALVVPEAPVEYVLPPEEVCEHEGCANARRAESRYCSRDCSNANARAAHARRKAEREAREAAKPASVAVRLLAEMDRAGDRDWTSVEFAEALGLAASAVNGALGSMAAARQVARVPGTCPWRWTITHRGRADVRQSEAA
jgi:hypothetical protein